MRAARTTTEAADAPERLERVKRDPEFEAALDARIRAARIGAHVSQGAPGEAVGISLQQVQKCDTGARSRHRQHASGHRRRAGPAPRFVLRREHAGAGRAIHPRREAGRPIGGRPRADSNLQRARPGPGSGGAVGGTGRRRGRTSHQRRGPTTMRRAGVDQRSAPRARRDVGRVAGAEYGPAVRAAVAALPDLLWQAEAAGAVVLARCLGQALSEAEGIVGRTS